MSEVKEEVKEDTRARVYEVDVAGPITEESALDICRAVRANTERLPFMFYVSSTGGDVNAGLVVNDVIDTIMANVTFVGQNFVGSMAVTLMQKHDYLRLCYKSTRFLCHGLKMTVTGKHGEVDNQLGNVLNVQKLVTDRYAECIGLEGDELIEKALDRDRIYSAHEALMLGTKGLVDGIILRDFGGHKYLCRTRDGLKLIDVSKHGPKDIKDLPVWEPPK